MTSPYPQTLPLRLGKFMYEPTRADNWIWPLHGTPVARVGPGSIRDQRRIPIARSLCPPDRSANCPFEANSSTYSQQCGVLGSLRGVISVKETLLREAIAARYTKMLRTWLFEFTQSTEGHAFFRVYSLSVCPCPI